jgi:penicillin-insensitive murein endopeptidase
MPLRGKGWKIPARWKNRKFHYGTDELIEAVKHAAQRVRAADRRATLGVADFSRITGGSSIWHSSHHSGRDVDLIFYHVDAKGRPMKPPEDGMIKFGGDGKPFLGPEDGESYPDADWADRRFDTRRNWELVEALLTDPSVRVQWVFVSEPLKARMLSWAKNKKRPRWVIEYARVVMREPSGSAPHDDHFHVRVYCTRSDRFHGCEDRGPVWQHEKKTFKYHGPERYDPVTWRVVLAGPRPLL